MPESGVPNHCVTDSVAVNDFATLTIMSNANLFDIHLARADIQGTHFETLYEQHLEKFTTNDEIIAHEDDLPEDEEEFNDFCDWLIEPCAVQIRQPAPELHGEITLQHFAFPKSHSLKLVPDGNGLKAIHIKSSSFKNSLSTEPIGKLCLPSSIRRICATQALIFPDPSGTYDYTCDVPRRVYVTGQEKFFKPITTSKDFEREVLKLNRMIEFDLPGRINVPELFGIVVSEDGLSAIGMLLN
ncbi:hypothetical protein PHISCL_05753 [Aspergillus sclerotialis]|uniref:Uncharacterized protein n=1 Tax=Aspergillus sclerotialis TaxID=2070753 RepID=A0A3A2ZFE9_9EURO|nr:hypothetical protein PHISCL_05753 [Aspergillus sclerotialis]